MPIPGGPGGDGGLAAAESHASGTETVDVSGVAQAETVEISGTFPGEGTEAMEGVQVQTQPAQAPELVFQVQSRQLRLEVVEARHSGPDTTEATALH